MFNVTITGHIGADARFVQKENTSFLSFTVAVHRRKGENTITTWCDCILYTQRADLATYFRKGRCVLITGRASVDVYQTRTGESQPSVFITTDAYEFLDNETPGN